MSRRGGIGEGKKEEGRLGKGKKGGGEVELREGKKGGRGKEARYRIKPSQVPLSLFPGSPIGKQEESLVISRIMNARHSKHALLRNHKIV